MAMPRVQAVTTHVPKEYRCFCRKMRNPEWNRNQSDVLHYCLEVCGRQLKTKGCEHNCVDLCHPGSCLPCNATINRKSVRQTAQLRHSSMPRHVDICHEGYDCHENVQQSCYCGKAVQEVLCTPDTAGVNDYSCESVCERTLDCKNHQCDAVCHSGPCCSCVLSPARVTTCPCGQTRLKKLYERVGVLPRNSCLDPVSTCGLT